MEGDCNVYAHSSLWMRPTGEWSINAKMVYRPINYPVRKSSQSFHFSYTVGRFAASQAHTPSVLECNIPPDRQVPHYNAPVNEANWKYLAQGHNMLAVAGLKLTTLNVLMIMSPALFR